MPCKCKCCDAKGSTADFLSALASLAFFVASHPAHFAFSKYRVTPEWTGRADRSSFKDLCKDCRLCAVGDGSVEGTDETHDEGDCECEYGEKQERPVNRRGRRRQRRQTQVRQERIQEKAEKSMANVQASEASVASAFGSEPSLCGDPSYARLGLIVDGEGKALRYSGHAFVGGKGKGITLQKPTFVVYRNGTMCVKHKSDLDTFIAEELALMALHNNRNPMASKFPVYFELVNSRPSRSIVTPGRVPPERVARLEDTLALARAERAIGQWYLQTVELQEKTVELQERLDMQTAMQTATLGIANLANSDSEVNTRNPKRFKAKKN